MPKAANRSNASRYRLGLRAVVLGCCASTSAAAISVPANAAPAGSGRAPSSASAVTGAAVTGAAVTGAAVTGAAVTGAGQQQGWAKAFARGQWSAAIELLETIPEGSRTAWHWLHLARALERRAQLVEAFAAYERVHDMAAEGARVVGMRDVERQAKSESAALARRIPWAEVSLGQPLPLGSLVFIDQQWLEPTRLRSPYPVNPGWHTFLVESNGEVLAARRAFFEEGQTRLVPLLTLDAIASGAAASGRRAVDRFGIEYDPVVEGAATGSVVTGSGNALAGNALAGNALSGGVIGGGVTDRGAAGDSPADGRLATGKAASDPIEGTSLDRSAGARASRPRSLTWRPDSRPITYQSAEHDAAPDGGGLLRASYVSLGAGALGTLVGTGFLISALNTRSGIRELGANCYSTRCEQSAVADAERSNRTWRARASAATFSYAVGLTGLVAGGVLLLIHRESSSRAATVNIADLSLELAPRFSPHGATLKGTF